MPRHSGAATRITLDDIASATGVSKATVSKALNDRKDVSVETRLLVRRTAADLGYGPRSTPTSVLPNVAMVSDTFDTLYTLQILNGAAQECARCQYALTATYLLVDVPADRLSPLSDEWLRTISSKGYIGLVLVTTEVSDHLVETCRQLDLPLAAIDPTNHPRPEVLSIGATNWNGGLDATQHLIGLGHRRIAFIAGSAGSIPSNERQQGYLSALRINGIDPDQGLTSGADFTFETGLGAARTLLSRAVEERPTAFFAGSDWSAMGVLEGVREKGLRVPEDISVVGFDDTALAMSSAPRLTSVHQPLRDMGSAAIRALADFRAGIAPTGPMKLNTHLVVRDSTGPAPKPR
jgi:Transcriptional regulators